MMPFAGGIEDVSNGTLILSAIAAVLYLFSLERPKSWKLSIIKTAGVGLLAVLATQQNAPWLLVLGLALGTLGDFFLSREGDQMFLAGLASFLAAHVAYIGLFGGHALGLATLDTAYGRLAAMALVMLSTSAALHVLLKHVGAALRLPVIAYCLAITAMGVTALAVPSAMVIAGALMFMASDTILAWEKFVETGSSPRRYAMRVAVWVLYYGAQLLITLAFMLG